MILSRTAWLLVFAVLIHNRDLISSDKYLSSILQQSFPIVWFELNVFEVFMYGHTLHGSWQGLIPVIFLLGFLGLVVLHV